MVFNTGVHNVSKSLDPRRVTRRNLHTQDPQTVGASTNCSRHGDLVTGICAPLTKYEQLWNISSKSYTCLRVCSAPPST